MKGQNCTENERNSCLDKVGQYTGSIGCVDVEAEWQADPISGQSDLDNTVIVVMCRLVKREVEHGIG